MLNNSTTFSEGKRDYVKLAKKLSLHGFLFFMLFSAMAQSNVSPWFWKITSISSALSIFAALVICFSLIKYKSICWFIVLGLLLSKVGRVFFGNSSIYFLSYMLFLDILFCLVGAALAYKYPKFIHKYFLFYFLITVPMMILQVSGVGKWAHIWTSHSYALRESILTLFMSFDIGRLSTLQLRPIGFTHANNVITNFILPGLAIHFGRIKTSKLIWGDVIMCSMVVLAMAKLSLAAFIIITFMLLLFGNKMVKLRMIKVLLLFVVLAAAHSFFFPGIFADGFNLDFLSSHATHRLMDFVAATSGEPELYKDVPIYFGALGGKSGVKVIDTSAGGYSAYALFAPALPYLLLLMFFLAPLYMKGLKRIKHIPMLKQTSLLFLIVIFLIPIYPSLCISTSFWLTAGFAFLPLFIPFSRDLFVLDTETKFKPEIRETRG